MDFFQSERDITLRFISRGILADMTVLKKMLIAVLFAFIAFAILNPNPFGNNPDIILDESYFLTSALSAIEHATLPGWDFPASGTYYGGPQTYVDTAVLVPVVGVVLALSDFSVTAAKLWVASNTGELLYILRLVSGVSALATLLFVISGISRRIHMWEGAFYLLVYILFVAKLFNWF